MTQLNNQVRIYGSNISNLILFSKNCPEQSITSWSGIPEKLINEEISFSQNDISINVVSIDNTIDNHLREISRIFNVSIDYLYQWNDMELVRIHFESGKVEQEIKLNIFGVIIFQARV
jgi:hypothetical protein